MCDYFKFNESLNESNRNFVTFTKDVRQTKLGECLLLHLGIGCHSACTVNTLTVKYKTASLLILCVCVCVCVCECETFQISVFHRCVSEVFAVLRRHAGFFYRWDRCFVPEQLPVYAA